MIPNQSPWIKQLRRTRPVARLPGDLETDVVIIGGGIAGVTTAYFTLRDTESTVCLLEAGKIAHGATGHNAGQAVTYFERSFSDLVAEYGLALAARSQKMIESTWELIEEIYKETQFETPFSRFTGYAGCSSVEQVIEHLRNNAWRRKAGLPTEPMYVAQECKDRAKIPAKFATLYSVVPQANLLSLLETDDHRYVGVIVDPKGVVNSARFCEELIIYMMSFFGSRFVLAEQTPVRTLTLQATGVHCALDEHEVRARRAVLCTNGFTSINIVNESGVDIDSKFHHSIHGTVGYMAGFLTPLDHPPVGISYFSSPGADTNEPYFYMTRRPYEDEKKAEHNLICIGGPEHELTSAQEYHHDDPFEEQAINDIDRFIHETHRHAPKRIDYPFRWHGLMGYTTNRVRLVGVEPCNESLLYNLGCNGTGILSSICGSKRIADLLAGKRLEPTIFDPRDQRCDLPR